MKPRKPRKAPVVPIRTPGSRADVAARLRALAAQVEAGEVDAVGIAAQTAEGAPVYDAHLVDGAGDVLTLFVAADGLAMRLRAGIWGGSIE